MAHIKVGENESIDRAVRSFKRLVEREGIIREWKKREYFEKPSTIRNRRERTLKKRLRKRTRKQGYFTKNY